MSSRKDSKCSRRNFLTLAGGAVAAGLTGLGPGRLLAQDTAGAKKEIIYRTLGRTSLKLPIVSMGVMNANVPQIVEAAYEAGIRMFDTAAFYQFGQNEQMVGSVINKLGVRDKVVIATKIYERTTRKGTTAEEVIREIIEQMEGSLRRLKTDYADIVYIHSVQSPDVVKNRAIMDGLAALKDKKMVRHVGISTHTAMADNLQAVAEVGFYDVVLTTYNFTMADDTALAAAIKAVADRGIGVVAMKTMAGGGRWPNPESRRNYSTETIARATLKWVLRNENISNSIPGFTVFEHLNQDFSVAYDLEYTPEEEELLKDNSIMLGMEFCRQCRKCLSMCPHGVDIPELMRTHMYAAQYGDLHQARTTYNEIPEKENLLACSSCDLCSARCSNSVNIPRRINELKTVFG